MNSQWMLGSCIITTLFACAAVVLTRVAALYRMPLRWIWVGASVASLVATLGWLIPRADGEVPVMSVASSSGSPFEAGRVAIPAASFMPASGKDGSLLHSTPNDTIAGTPSVMDADAFALPRFPRRIEQAVAVGWLCISVFFTFTLVVAAIRLRVDARAWRPETVAGIDVRVSDEFGPAIVGLHSPVIVVPEWVLVLPRHEQRAIVLHEAEHLMARDPWLIAAGLLTVVLMPWNPGIWWSWRGLRRTIELDCDARVVARGVECSEYANVLLGAWQRARGSWIPATAFAERSSGLGSRVEHLMRPEPRRRAMNTGLGLAATALLVMGACEVPSPQSGEATASEPYPLIVVDGVPRPKIPPQRRFIGKVVVETTTTPTFAIRWSGPMVPDTSASKLYPTDVQVTQRLDAPASERLLGPMARYGAILYYTQPYIDRGGRILPPGVGDMAVRSDARATSGEQAVAGAINWFFRGITLRDEQRSRAAAIQRDYWARMRPDSAEKAPFMVTARRYSEGLALRNAELRGLLATDIERAAFDANAAQFPLSYATHGQISQDALVMLVQPVQLDADRRAKAMAIIGASVTDLTLLYQRDPTPTAERARIHAAREAKVLALLTAEERAKVDARRARTKQRL